MTCQMKQTLFTGLALFIAGVFFHMGSWNDEGLMSYVLLVFGAWELGEALSQYFFKGEEEEKISWKEKIEQMKRSVVHISVPMLTSMLIEMVMVEDSLRLVTVGAYILTLAIYILFILGFLFYSHQKTE